MIKRIIITLITISLLVSITAVIIAIGRGYRFDIRSNKVQSTGLLVASSFPTGAQVFVDDHLVSATNSTITLPPGIYNVKIAKDGYLSWSKKLKVQGEIVTKADALLLPVAPDLRPVTTTGALNPSISFDGTQIAYGVATASAQKQGIWIMNISDRPLALQSAAHQIARDTEYIKFSQAEFIWAPDGKQIIAIINDTYYLLNTDGLNELPQDITLTNELQFTTWTAEFNDKQEALIRSLKPNLQKMVRDNIKIISWSPDETKILYEATASASMPLFITPPLIGANSQPEDRNLKSQNIYVYDIKEDKNFRLKEMEAQPLESPPTGKLPEDTYRQIINYHLSPPFHWLPDSDHLVFVEKSENSEEIKIIDYDNTNKASVFSAPFIDNYVFPFPSGTRLIILTTLNPNTTTPNLYAVNLM